MYIYVLEKIIGIVEIDVWKVETDEKTIKRNDNFRSQSCWIRPDCRSFRAQKI